MSFRSAIHLMGLTGLLVAGPAPGRTPTVAPGISDVHASPASFVPTLGESVQLSARLGFGGRLWAEVLDRDGFIVRRLAEGKAARAGDVRLSWNGRDDAGEIVADDAYSFRIELRSAKGRSTYFPADSEPEMVVPKVQYYDRVGGQLVYELPWPARVHAQAGASEKKAGTDALQGPMMKTLVNREPRTVGRVLDSWNGFDESGTIYVPDLPGFVVSVMATRLPENSVIATGSRGPSFLQRALSRKGASRFTFKPPHHHHHLGLNVLEDVSPQLDLEVEGASRLQDGKSWKLDGEKLRLRVRPLGPSAQGFSRLPASLYVFNGTKEIRRTAVSDMASSVDLSRSELLPGSNIVTVCWATEYGPSATIALRLLVSDQPPAGAGVGAIR